MIGSGKYSLQGIREKGAAGFKAVLIKTGWGASLLAGPFSKTTDLVLQFAVEYLANKGIVVLNLGVIKWDEIKDPAALLRSIEAGLIAAEKPGLTEAEGKAFDEQVKKDFRRAVRYIRK